VSGMDIQAVVSQVESEIAKRLLGVSDELDLAIREIRDSVLPRPSKPNILNSDEPG